jgi:lipopolysaccharide export system permease protein
LTLPGRLYELFPIGVLIGSLYALTVLARHSEITVLRAAGLSTRDLLVQPGEDRAGVFGAHAAGR